MKIIFMVIFCIADGSPRPNYLAVDSPRYDTLIKIFCQKWNDFNWSRGKTYTSDELKIFQVSWPQQSVLKKNAAPEFYSSTKRKPKDKRKLPKLKNEFDTFANHADAVSFVLVFLLNIDYK